MKPQKRNLKRLKGSKKKPTKVFERWAQNSLLRFGNSDSQSKLQSDDQRRPERPASPLVGFRKYTKLMEKNNQTESANWGGARQGAGRKSMDAGKHYTFRSTPKVDDFLSSYEGNKTKFINDAIEHYIATL